MASLSRLMGPVRGRRRHRVLALAALLVGLMLLNSVSPTSASADQAPPGILPPGNWTEAQANWLVNDVRLNEQVLPQRFADVSKLAALGFVNIGAINPGGYMHYVNLSWLSDSHILDPNWPESLVYHIEPNGSLTLVAGMYFLWPDTTMETIPSLVRWIPGWHWHSDICYDDEGRVVGAFVNGHCTAGQQEPTPMMHVWIVDNACGHRFGGLDEGGLHCNYDMDHDMDTTTTTAPATTTTTAETTSTTAGTATTTTMPPMDHDMGNMP
jgi:hypothetical protein